MLDGGHAILDELIERDPDLWFDDGNIVFIAQSVAFRVHKSILSRHSDVFIAIFATPQASQSEQTHWFDGVPSLHMSHTSYEFRQLIRALYGQISCLDPAADPTFPVLAAIARMSHNYQIAPLLSAAISRLKQTFTDKLHVWDVKRYEAQAHPVEAVNLFRALDRPDMLITALYACCQLPARAVVQGMERTDGVVERLAPADLEVCWELRKTLTAHDAAILCRFVEPFRAVSGSGCASVERCAEAVDGRLLVHYREEPLIEFMGDDPLDPYFANSVRDLYEKKEVCQFCAQEMVNRVDELRQKLWNELPSLMGLTVDGWGGV